MYLLVKENRIYEIAPFIVFGTFEGEQKWKLEDERGFVAYYVIDDGYTLVENVEVPDDYEHGKYFYENGEFVLNEEWKPYVTPEERIAQLEAQVAIHEENDAELLYQVCLLQLGLSEEDL